MSSKGDIILSNGVMYFRNSFYWISNGLKTFHAEYGGELLWLSANTAIHLERHSCICLTNGLQRLTLTQGGEDEDDDTVSKWIDNFYF